MHSLLYEHECLESLVFSPVTARLKMQKFSHHHVVQALATFNKQEEHPLQNTIPMQAGHDCKTPCYRCACSGMTTFTVADENLETFGKNCQSVLANKRIVGR
jgi:hypothetical protein